MRFFCWLWSLIPFISFGQVHLFVTVPPSPQIDSLFVAGSFNQWNPHDSNYRCFRKGQQWEVVLPKTSDRVEYKFTRGSWQTVEATALGTPIPNRVWTQDSMHNMHVTIQGWEQPQVSTATGNIKIDSTSLPGKVLRIYLPGGYLTSTTLRYSVIYAFDGQNCYDVLTSAYGEWQLDETLRERELQNRSSYIVVAMDHSGNNRLPAYTPFVNATFGGGGGKQTALELVSRIKPMIDQQYRTLSDRNHTAVMGNSLGGLMAIYVASTYPSIFGKAYVFSPSVWWSDSIVNLTGTMKEKVNWYWYEGGNESVSLVFDCDRVINNLLQHKQPLYLYYEPQGTHAEVWWAKAFKHMMDEKQTHAAQLLAERRWSLGKQIQWRNCQYIGPKMAENITAISANRKATLLGSKVIPGTQFNCTELDTNQRFVRVEIDGMYWDLLHDKP